MGRVSQRSWGPALRSVGKALVLDPERGRVLVLARLCNRSEPCSAIAADERPWPHHQEVLEVGERTVDKHPRRLSARHVYGPLGFQWAREKLYGVGGQRPQRRWLSRCR